MDTNQLVNHIANTYKECLDIIRKKNADYTNGHDAFGNFRFSSLVRVPLDKAILVRMADKLARATNIIDNDKVNVKDETVKDTLVDLINYAAILLAFLSTNDKNHNTGSPSVKEK